jgi:hypothetical protein
MRWVLPHSALAALLLRAERGIGVYPGGKISVDSEIDAGTDVCLLLPLFDARTEALPKEEISV